VSHRPTLLFVSPRFLFPANEGGKIRTSNILRHMKGGAFRVVLTAPAPSDAARFATDIESVCDRFISWPGTPASMLRRVGALADRRPVSVATDASAAGSASIAAALRDRPEVVLVDFIHGAVLAPDQIPCASVLFTHNVEAEIFERHARVATGLRRLVWRNQARKMARFEGVALRRFNRVIAVSSRDADVLRSRYGLRDVDRIDTGVDLDFFRPEPEPEPPGADEGTVVFAGVMDSAANIDGIEFLRDQVWPMVARARPAARAVIVGRNPPAAVVAAARQRGLGWTFTGYVDDIRPHVASGHVFVIPLRVGSGTRIKAFEAMAMGRAVVSTTVGVEGLDVEDGVHLLMADDPGAFAAAILRLLDDTELRGRLAQAARRLLEDRFSWSRVARQVEVVCQRALGGDASHCTERAWMAGPSPAMTVAGRRWR
jgi:polysaccharide biosynthesis protein PslH